MGEGYGLMANPLETKAFQFGGIINERVIGRGLNTGAIYDIAEKGPEEIRPMGGTTAGDDRPIYITVMLDGTKIGEKLYRESERGNPIIHIRGLAVK